ncbi:SDR family oxidoreductase [Micromonospora sp. NPDC085948]|uniref:SDR family oxidoreductase n=1 Tax=Micromonospora sp. NPDC085948 TaxID=3155293 RepID=UPI0034421C42
MTGGRVVLVTGGAGSVGREIVRGFAATGATVLINCFHSWPAAKELAAEVVAAGGRAKPLRASVARPAQLEQMFDQVRDEYGRLDVLVNNAATGTFATIDDITDEHLDRAFDINVKGPLWCSRTARPLLAATPGSCIVNVSSMGATHAPANYLSVGVSKAALESLTRYLAAEFAADDIRVNTASAGLIENDVGRRFPGFPSLRDNLVDATPMRRLATPEDLAGVVLLLASPEAGWITGQTVLADGGLSLHHRALSPDAAPPAPAPSTAVTPPEEAAVAPSEEAAVTLPEQAAVAPPEATSDAIPVPTGHDATYDPVVVVGMGIAVPGASDPDGFWSLLNEGAELFVEVPPERWWMDGFHHPDPTAPDKTYQRRSGFITDLRPHPAMAGEPIVDDDTTDFTIRWLRHCVHQALDGVKRRPGDRYGVWVGYTPDGSQHLFEALASREFLAMAGTAADEPAVRDDLRILLDRVLPHQSPDRPAALPHQVGRAAVAGILPDDARVTMVDTACSSSLYSIDLGIRDLLTGDADIALCGGSFALMPSGSVLFAKLGGLSKTGAVRALDRAADGVLFSDGAGVVALKRLSRALADGDQIHGILAGSGLSADGKGKAIYAPSSSGQELAVHRALTRSTVRPGDVGMVIAHATGTPAGDEAEFLSLRAAYAGDAPIQVTSNKSLIGHTGWAAGVVSVIHALLALRHGVIPAQYRFTGTPESFGTDTSNLAVPSEPVAWPPLPDRCRTAAVSAFGFGGTNAHLLVSEYRPDVKGAYGYGEPHTDPLVLVGWSGHLPGVDDTEAVADCSVGRAGAPHTFGPVYPHPPFPKLQMPPPAARATDRTQLMLVECMQRLDGQVRQACERRRERTGVVVAHAGPTRNAVLLALRCYLDELDRVGTEARDPEALARLLKQLRQDVTGRIAAPTEDSFPGEMPNVIAARLCNYFDLRGLNITVDGGGASLADAFEVAAHYLRFGDLDLALVAGVNGNTLASWRAVFASEGELAEGAFLFALTRRSVAEAEGLPILAELDRLSVAEVTR